MSFGETTQLLLFSQPKVKLSWWQFVSFLCRPLRDKNDDNDDDDYDNNDLDGDEEDGDDGDDDNESDDGVELEH